MRTAFSLIELSIVLVILGLLTGGILAGQSLIRASELRAVSTDSNRFIVATQAFRDKYMAMPGDMANAQSFWNAATHCPGTSAQGSTTAATCNGDGNGRLSDFPTGNTSNELFRFWQHLANAGLVEGQYSGVTGGTSNSFTAVSGTNVPRGRIGNSGWSLYNWGASATVDDTSIAGRFEGSYGNGDLLIFGAPLTNHLTMTALLVPEELWNVDTKTDDGKPGTGRTRVQEALTNCHDATPSTSAAIAGAANYRLTYTGPSCTMLTVLYP